MMDRRTFIAGIATSLIAPLATKAQSTGKVWRIGALTNFPPEGSSPAQALRDGLRELGYMEGQNIAVDWRWAGADAERFPDLAADLVRRNVDVIVATTNPAIQAAQRATTTVPIVMVFAIDPVGLGFVASLARPESNITGLTLQDPEVVGKRLQLLRDAVPNLSRVAVLGDPTVPTRPRMVTETENAVRALGIELQVLEARSPSEFDRAFAAMAREGAGALLVLPSSTYFVNRARIVEHAVKRRLPTMCLVREYVEAGCLMSYSARISDLFRRAATFVDKILKGAKPGDLPVEQPTRFELVINLKTAKALGLTIPPSLLLRADQVIE